MKTLNLSKVTFNVFFSLVKTKVTPLIECKTYLNFYPGDHDFPRGFFYDSHVSYKQFPNNKFETFRWGFTPGLTPDKVMKDYVLHCHKILCGALRSLDKDQTINS